MLYETFSRAEINPGLPDSGQDIRLTAYCRPHNKTVADDGARWAVLILPGGGYEVCAPGEGEPVALSFLAAGVQAFVLRYSVAPARWPQAFLEACASVDFIRRNAERYGISPDRVAVCGFSAGGHLAGCVANLWCEDGLLEPIGVEPPNARPDALILGYPVIAAAASAEGSTFPNLLGPDWRKSTDVHLSLETSVTRLNPPAFLWATCADGSVLTENTLMYASALRQAEVPFDLHIFMDGPHAMGLATEESAWDEAHCDAHAANWFPLCTDWLGRIAGRM